MVGKVLAENWRSGVGIWTAKPMDKNQSSEAWRQSCDVKCSSRVVYQQQFGIVCAGISDESVGFGNFKPAIAKLENLTL